MKTKTLSMFVLLLGIMSLYSCSNEPINNYNNCIIYQKHFNNLTGPYVVIRHKKCAPSYDTLYAFKRVYVMQLDYDKHNVGDTIK